MIGQSLRASAEVNTVAEDTITQKAVRIEQKASLLLDAILTVRARVCRPTSEKSGNSVTKPPTDHALFALEAAEQSIDFCTEVLGEIRRGL